jgi:hypothetical protein
MFCIDYSNNLISPKGFLVFADNIKYGGKLMEWRRLKNYLVISVKDSGLFNKIGDICLSPLRIVLGGNTYEIVRDDKGRVVSFDHLEPTGILRIVKYCFVFAVMFIPLVIPLILILGGPLIVVGGIFKILAWNKKTVRKNYAAVYDYIYQEYSL